MNYPSFLKSDIYPGLVLWVIFIVVFFTFNGMPNDAHLFLTQFGLVTLFSALLILAWVFLYQGSMRFLWVNIYIKIDKDGITFGPRHVGPLKSLDDFETHWGVVWSNPIKGNPLSEEIRFDWNSIKTIKLGRWQREWNKLFETIDIVASGGSPGSLRKLSGVYYVIIEDTNSNYYISILRKNGPFFPASVEKKFAINTIKKFAREDIIDNGQVNF